MARLQVAAAGAVHCKEGSDAHSHARNDVVLGNLETHTLADCILVLLFLVPMLRKVDPHRMKLKSSSLSDST